ncbi:MAG: hypothetical protein WDO73_22345 [Ignavibacteriota bacterium]
MAGIQALVNQYTGNTSGVGNPAKPYYELAAGNYGVFHAVTLGDNTVNCSGTVNCFGAVAPSGHNRFAPVTPSGALSTSNNSFSPAYPAASHYSFAAGLGSVDAYNLAFYWKSVSR